MTNSAIIEKFIVGRVEPHIYAFETGTVPNYLKIGDTYRPVETRLNEWRRYFVDLQKRYDEPATAGDEYFRDLSVHEYIIREKGCKRLEKTTLPNIPYYSNEFFENATTDDVNEAIQDIRKSATDKDGHLHTPLSRHLVSNTRTRFIPSRHQPLPTSSHARFTRHLECP